jgi:hypothetical protein
MTGATAEPADGLAETSDVDHACRVCDGSGKLTVPDGDGESASEQACPDPIHDRQPAPELDDRELLEAAARALRSFTLCALTVRTSLDKPYTDDPRWSPWTRWLEPEARRAHDLSRAIRKRLAKDGIRISGPDGAVPGLRPELPADLASQPELGHDGQQRYIDELHDLVRDMLQSLPDTADEQEWRDRAGALSVCDPDGQPYRAHTEDDDEAEDGQAAYSEPPRADPSGHDPYQFPTLAELGGEKFADYPSESGL